MDSLSIWILSIAGVVVLGVMIDFILPSGETNKYVKGMFAFITIFVIISPIPNWINGFNADNLFGGGEIILQEDFLFQMNQKRMVAVEESIERELSTRGITNLQIIISANIFRPTLIVDAVTVDCLNMVLSPRAQNYNITEEITRSVTRIARVSADNVFIINFREV